MSLPQVFLVAQLCAVATAIPASLRGAATAERELRTRIIGGNSVTKGRYSYAVSLQDEVGHFCGGSLIAPDVVLSAAHCAGGDNYKAVVGRHHLETSEGEELDVKTELMHPDYDSDTTDNDFMLLFLSSNASNVGVIEVSPDVVSEGTRTTVMGWGDTHIDEDITELATELMEVEVVVLSNDECEKSESNEPGYEDDYSGQITDSMLCAENVEAKDSCQGDSGGPLVIRTGSGDVQVGVVSWGIGCAHDHFPGVYSRVSSQYEWIRENVCRGSLAPPASFGCESMGVASSTQPLATQGNPSTTSGALAWTSITEEDFTNGLGVFGTRGNGAKRYTSAKNRRGVVRIDGGADRSSAIESAQIDLSNSSFSKLRIGLSFYATDLDHSGDICIGYALDNGSITGEKCWSSLHAFENARWYDNESIEFAVANARNVSARIRVDGSDDTGGVLIDSVKIEGIGSNSFSNREG